MRTCLIDLRCLQDADYSERGIGRHARTVLSYARAALPGVELAGLTDRNLPPLSGADRSMIDTVRLSAYTGALAFPCCFVQLSPMTHDPLFVARLLDHPDIPAAAAVYDFIPLDDPARYLAAPGVRLEYHLALRWLARHTLFLPISEDAAGGLRRVLGVQAGRIAVTGAPLAEAFEDLVPGVGRHVLVVAGSDPRKNPEVVVRAHARSAAMQAGGVPLVITGAYDEEWIVEQRAAAAALGGDPLLIEAPGHVDEGALLDLYGSARLVVAPSRAEGFSLPVIEAMAAGVPVLASDIAAHRELLHEGFDPDDDESLAARLDEALTPGWRADALARQAPVWPRFRAEAVAGRFWDGVARLRPGTPARSRRPRVAMLTPLPPSRTGVADYSAACCADLGALVDLHLFTPTEHAAWPDGAASVSPLSAFPLVSSRFDRVVAVLGNSVFHLEILRLLLRYGGAAILHDGRMLDLYAGHTSLELTQAMAERELGRPLRHNEIWSWLAGDQPPAALILSDVAAAAEPLVMHSLAGAAEVGRRYGIEVRHLPFCLYRPLAEADLSPGARAAARARLGVTRETVFIASFGYVHPSKAPVDCVWALRLLRSWGVAARLHFVGASSMEHDTLTPLVRELGLGEFVQLPGAFVDEQGYRDHLVGADLAIQLRSTGVGSISGALSDCISAGLPAVASRTLAEALDAPDYVHAVPDFQSPVLVAEAALGLLGRGDTDAARRAYATTHGFGDYARELCEALGLCPPQI